MTNRLGRFARPLTFAVLMLTATSAHAASDSTSLAALKAAFLLNFAKFAEWNTLQQETTIILCVLDDERVGAALVESVRGQKVESHKLEVWRLKVDDSLPACHLVFAAGSDPRQVMTRIGRVKDLPVVTVSDARGFAESGGMVEFFQEEGRMRFAVNIETVQRSGVRLSSRLLNLAKIIRNDHAH
jgi:hypothetical protein